MEQQNNSIIELWFIRHGQTFDNLSGTMAGSDGGRLTEKGINQAQLLGERLQKIDFSHVYVSDLYRTKQTYNNIVQKSDYKTQQQVTYTDLLREKWAGTAQGMKIKEFQQMGQKQKVEPRDWKFPEGESWNDVYLRIEHFLKQIANQYLKKSLQNQNQNQNIQESENKCLQKSQEQITNIEKQQQQIQVKKITLDDENMLEIQNEDNQIQIQQTENKKSDNDNNNEQIKSKIKNQNQKIQSEENFSNTKEQTKNSKNNNNTIKQLNYQANQTSSKNTTNNKNVKKQSIIQQKQNPITPYKNKQPLKKNSYIQQQQQNQQLQKQKLQQQQVQQKPEQFLFDPNKISEYPKYLCVCHGGVIQEVYNVINFYKHQKQPTITNNALNCSIHAFRVFCINTGNVCSSKTCKVDDISCLEFKCIIKNDNTHIIQYQKQTQNKSNILVNNQSNKKKSFIKL